MLTLPTPHVTTWLRLFALALLFVSISGTGLAQATPGFLPFISDGFSDGNVDKIVVQPDGKILVSGRFTHVSGLPRVGLARLDAKGNIDASFVPVRGGGFDFVLQPDGKILVVQFGVSRLNADGSLDTSFTSIEPRIGQSTGSINALALSADGKIYIGGRFDEVGGLTRHSVARLNTDGTVDASFTDVQTTSTLPPQSNPFVVALAVQPDGKLLVGGVFDGISGSDRTAIARLNPDGTADSSFSDPGIPDAKYVSRIVIQPDGKLLLTGNMGINGPQGVYSGLVRLNGDGSLDGAFVNPNSQFLHECVLQADAKLICNGVGFSQFSGILVTRLNAHDGSVDPSFSSLTTYRYANAIALQQDGKILVGGDFEALGSMARPRTLVRLNPNGTVDKPLSTAFDYDGDLKADISIFRPSNGTWYIIRSGVGYSTMTWGVAGDKITPADFDGDAKTDLAVYRPSNGTWYLFNSADNTFGTLQWGETNDVPLAGDYNGDRKADFMIYRPSNGLWYLQSSIDFAKTIRSYGVVGDKPMVGDFDGDYVADYTVYRPSSTEWRPLTSFIGGIAGRSWGNVTDIRVPADYDGDGKTDIAIYRPSTGEWWILPSSQPPTTFYRIPWGIPGDEPVAADYDGDGKADRAVFRPSNNTWYIAGSSSGILVFPFGEAGDIPTQTVFP